MKTDRELLELAASKKEAIAAGANRFFTGKPCKRGHISERNLYGACLECRRQDDKALYERDKESRKIKHAKDPIQWAQTRGMLL